MRHVLSLMILALVVVATAGGDDDGRFRECSATMPCDQQGGIPGACMPSPESDKSWCAYPDPTCASGDRWGVLAGDGLAESCVDGVASPDAGVDGGVDAGTPDASADAMPAIDAGPDAGPDDPLALTFGGAGTDFATAVAVDATAAIAVTGTISGAVDLGTGAVTGPAFIAKYSSAGAHVWSRAFPGAGNDIAIDGNGDIIVIGKFSGTLNLGGSDLVSSGGSQDAFLVKLNGATGAHVWSARFGGSGSDSGLSVALDGADNVIIGGSFQNTVNFGGANITSNGGFDLFVVKLLGVDGAHQWSIGLGGTSNDNVIHVAADPSGNALATGEFRTTVDFGDGPQTSAGINDVFVVKRAAATGAALWSRTAGSAGIDDAFGIAADAAGNAIVTGDFSGTIDLGGGNLTSAGDRDAFVAKYASATGGHLWSNRYGGTGPDKGNAVAVDGTTLIVIGEFEGSANFGGGALTSAGSVDVFVARYNVADGAHVTSRRFGGISFEDGDDIAPGSGGDAIMVGAYRDTVDFGPAVRTSAGMSDIFVVRDQL